MSDAVTVTAPATSSRRLAAGHVRRQQPERERVDEHADREVDEEDPVPVEGVREDAAERDADAAAAGGDEPEDAHRLARSAGSVKRVMMSESATADTIAPPTPCTARAATRTSWVGEPAGERREREQRDADEEQPPVAEEVAEPAAEQQEAAEGEQVGVHDPRERRLREAEVFLIDGSATFTMVASSTIIRPPRQRTYRASQRVRLSIVIVRSSFRGRPSKR